MKNDKDTSDFVHKRAQPPDDSAPSTAAQNPIRASAKTLHQLRTPLSHIIGYSEMLIEEAEEKQLEHFTADLRKIRAAGEQLLGELDHLFGEKPKPLQPISVDSAQTVSDRVPEPLASSGGVAQATRSPRILVADDDSYIQEVLKDRLAAMGFQVILAGDGNRALELIQREAPQLAFLDIEMPKLNGLEVLREIRRREKDFPVVMITAHGSIGIAVEAMKEGAFDFIPKPFTRDHITLVVQKALEQQRLKQNIAVLTQEIDKRHQLIAGKSEKLQSVIAAAKKSAASSSTVLLLGESGVGKELFARGIHNWSDRRERPFVAINCVGLSKDLLESELFGYERGAFTGAQQRKKGKMELADGGTVFLDEIGDISEALQTKLLRFLQEREFERLGGTELIRVDVRIIAATNRNLQAAVKEGRFREDLYYRINVVPLKLPPLRERKEDLPELARHFLQRCASQSKRHFSELSEVVMKKLLAYDWPGNVRELANVIERAIVLGQPPTIQVDDLPIEILATPRQGLKSEHLNYQESIDDLRRELIVKALEQSHGNRTGAAKLLGLERAYFQKLIKSLGIS